VVLQIGRLQLKFVWLHIELLNGRGNENPAECEDHNGKQGGCRQDLAKVQPLAGNQQQSSCREKNHQDPDCGQFDMNVSIAGSEDNAVRSEQKIVPFKPESPGEKQQPEGAIPPEMSDYAAVCPDAP